MTTPIVLVTHAAPDDIRIAIVKTFGLEADVRFLPDLSVSERAFSIRNATAVLTYDPFSDLGREEMARLECCGLIQCLTAGIDYLPLSQIPPNIPIAYNAGGFAEPMAEHVVAMTMAGSKRLAVEHRLMQQGEFNQFVPTKRIAGGTCGILGFGATGREVGRLMRGLGMRIEAINRSGRTEEAVDFIGTLEDTDRILTNADVLVITLALTKITEGLIDEDRLSLMKPDAVLVNVARGEIVDEDGLYNHLLAHPGFTACLEAWWIEPVRHGRFETKYPFLDLPNVIASPHNSGMTEGTVLIGVCRGAENVLRFIRGDEPRFVATEDIKMR
ncbi:MAG: 2-hydroxyacid dehydrogenase [Pseudomonadota bacterium]|nr:2-hydroxyacid dehydrogenase [Pseudomonadota bacterium]